MRVALVHPFEGTGTPKRKATIAQILLMQLEAIGAFLRQQLFPQVDRLADLRIESSDDYHWCVEIIAVVPGSPVAMIATTIHFEHNPA